MLKRLTIARTLTIILWLLLPVIAVRIQFDPDVWWQLRSGEQNLAAGQIVQPDLFSYTFAGSTARIQHEWLAQPVLVAFWSIFGHAGLSLYAVICAMVGMAFLYRTCAGGPYLKAFIIVLGATSASVFWGARPLMLSFILAAVTLWIVYGYHREGKSRRLWILPPMFVLWGNLHGGWPQGALILLAAAAGMAANWVVFRRISPHRDPAPSKVNLAEGTAETQNADGSTHYSGLTTRDSLLLFLRFLIPCILAAVLMPLLNPYGPSMLTVPFDTIGFDFQPIYVAEWKAPTFDNPNFWGLGLTLVLTAAVIALDWRRADFVEIIMFAGVTYMALTGARHVAFATSVALIPLSIHASNLGADRGWIVRPMTWISPRRARLNLALVSVIGFFMAVYYISRLSPASIDQTLREALPVDAVEQLHALKPPQRLFNSFNFGGYLIHFARDYPVYIDGRADLYRDFTWTYIAIMKAEPIWREEFERWDINSVLVEPTMTLVDTLRVEPGWRVAYEDDVAVLFVKEG